MEALKVLKYPQFRKYKNGMSYFKFISPDIFEEIKVSGTLYLKDTIEVKQFPEMNFVYDMLMNFEDFASLINEQEFEEQNKKVLLSKVE